MNFTCIRTTVAVCLVFAGIVKNCRVWTIVIGILVVDSEIYVCATISRVRICNGRTRWQLDWGGNKPDHESKKTRKEEAIQVERPEKGGEGCYHKRVKLRGEPYLYRRQAHDKADWKD